MNFIQTLSKKNTEISFKKWPKTLGNDWYPTRPTQFIQNSASLAHLRAFPIIYQEKIREKKNIIQKNISTMIFV